MYPPDILTEEGVELSVRSYYLLVSQLFAFSFHSQLLQCLLFTLLPKIMQDQPDWPSETSTTDELTVIPALIYPELLVSLATAPLLLTLMAARRLAEELQTTGIASEELFRGDRLPLLPRSDLSSQD